MDSLCLKTGIHAITPPISVAGGGLEVRTNPSQVSAVGKSTATTTTKNTTPFSRFSFKYPLKSFWPGRGGGGGGGRGGEGRCGGMALDDAVLVEDVEEKVSEDEKVETGNWILKILHVRSLWRDEEQGKSCGTLQEEENADDDRRKGSDGGDEDDGEGCDGCRVEDDDEKEAEFDRDSFSRLLRKVSLAEARLFAQMSYLGNLAYCIPKIQPGNLLRCYGLRFVTSSIDKRELAAKTEKNQELAEIQEQLSDTKESDTKEVETQKNNGQYTKESDTKEVETQKNNGHQISASTAYQVAASAASYLHSHTTSILPFKSSKSEVGEDSREESSGSRMTNSEMVSLMATTDSVTAVVAAKEEVKQAVADDLNSTHSSPCEWFVCDDDQSGTRFFVIQGSETLASWQANLLFEPIQFEGLDVIVHRGIYEAAKGMYEQMLPEVQAHLKSHGDRARFRFTGHSLGGSLALLINLMLLIRNEAPVSSLLPVITFGAPSVMCGGDNLLRKLGLPRSHVQAVTMHRDIVPRAFSCNYPNHVAEFLKAVNGNFRNHPCLNSQKLLYAPMGDFLILQPDEKFSPSHELLPSGIGLYLLSRPLSDLNDQAEKQLRDAKAVFLNSPHPLEILRDRSAYGSGGTIQRDHDMNSYLKCVWWPLVAPHGVNAGIVIGRPVSTGMSNVGQEQFNFSGIVQNGKESLKRFSRLVASQHMHLFVVLLFPARMLLLGTNSVISFH
ncbi:hypothetical protein L484_001911 [Morus notabilis]|uniref:Fungal lipase-type domain-containing protein n=1 Tax=Morus notabilis TaxID=981085 RepID=W9R6Q1_9ROSA|nr:hypothetical protein L484_001911 [Morus notabilis]